MPYHRPTDAPLRLRGRQRAHWPWLLLLAGLALLQGCSSVPLPRPPAQAALAPQPGGALAEVEARVLAAHGPGSSGLRLLRANHDALAWRLALIDSARHSLDLQYYVWFGDKVGQLLMARVVAAADRGVRVRLLFDDLNTLLHDMGSLELRDATLARIDRHPNIEIRVFNAWQERRLAGRLWESVARFDRLNRRMHNKQMVADNRVAVIGGRNIGDEYFGLNPAFNFMDLDVLGVGPVARQASTVFDRYWNSDWVRRIPRPDADALAAAASDADRDALQALQGDALGRLLLAGARSWQAELDGLAASLHPGTTEVHTDNPSRDAAQHNHMPEAFRALLQTARSEVLVTNAYVIPDARFVADLQALHARGVRLRLLTNSLASHDVPAVNSHYETWRPALLAAGVQLHELRPDAREAAAVVHTPPVTGRFIGLHTKALVIDRSRCFVGSMNLDPRSEVINSEMGVRMHSPGLCAALAAVMEHDMQPANAWQLRAEADGALAWHSDAGTLRRQPARSAWQRLQNQFFKLFPPSLY